MDAKVGEGRQKLPTIISTENPVSQCGDRHRDSVETGEITPYFLPVRRVSGKLHNRKYNPPIPVKPP